MKTLSVFLLLSLLLVACKSDDEGNNPKNQLVGAWKLIEMSGSVPNSTTTGTDMEWQESYTFMSDRTVLKQRERNGTSTEITGSFDIFERNGFTVVEIYYPTDSEIIGSCVALEEWFYLESPTRLIGEWQACDGPGLVYAKQ